MMSRQEEPRGDEPGQTEPRRGEPVESPTDDEIVARLDRHFSASPVTPLAGPAPPVEFVNGKYRLKGLLGFGSFGVVYEAVDKTLNRRVAIKLPRPEVLLDSESLLRFEAEAVAVAKLDHPAIVPLLEAHFDGPTPYMVSAFCPGPNLAAWLTDRDAPAAPDEAAAFVAELADAVHYAHQEGVLHRDIKPSNVLAEPANTGADVDSLAGYRPRLTDFGLAKLVEAGLHDTRSSLLIGTPLYMAPEQFRGKDAVTAATDVYSLGVVLFELLTRETPVAGETYVEVLDRLRDERSTPLLVVDSDLPVDLGTICEKCLAYDPGDRYASAGDLRDDLRRFLQGAGLHARPATWRDRLRRWTGRPERMMQAGWFTFWLQSAICLWVPATYAADAVLGLIPSDLVLRVGRESCLVVALTHLPLAILGWRLANGSLWAYPPVALLSVAMLAFMVAGLTQTGVVFDAVYPTLHSKISTFFGLILGGLINCALCLLAVPAWVRRSRNQRNGSAIR